MFSQSIVVILVLWSYLASSQSPRQINPDPNLPNINIRIDTQVRYQVIDGFGVSQAFQRARQMQRLSTENQQKALDLLFSRESGAGLSILRNGIGSSVSYDHDWMKSIEPVSPEGSFAQPKYEWDGDDAGQVWLTKEAIKRGVPVIYADAWSAPAFMKTNGNDSNGGYLCGVRDAECESGVWKHAFADYLMQYLQFYQEKEGISITHIGFLNEPDLNQTYASMQSSGFQAGDFVRVLETSLKQSGFRESVKIVCCEATGWTEGEAILAELQSVSGAESSIDVYSAHGYSVHPALPFKTSKKAWQTEWADLNGKWNTAWDNLGKEGEGIKWANKIHSALTLSNVSAFLYWIGAEQSKTNGALINLQNGTVVPSARLWAFAHFSRFVRPEATRVEASSDTGYVSVSAFENVDGKIAIHVINNGRTDVSAAFQIQGVKARRANMTAWVTNSGSVLQRYNVTGLATWESDRATFNGTIGQRSLVSIVL